MEMATLLLTTVTKIETQAVFDVFEKVTKKKRGSQRIDEKTYYMLGLIGNTNVVLVQSESGINGSMTIEKAISNINPSALIVIGFAFGVDPKNQKLGDILVSKSFQEILRNDNEIVRADAPLRVSPSLLDIANSVIYDWKISNAHIGTIVYGGKLNSQQTGDLLLKLVPDVIGDTLDPLSLSVINRYSEINYILIKSIIGWADEGKIANNEVQLRSAINAALFVLAMLQRINDLPMDFPSDLISSRKISNKDSNDPRPNLAGISRSESKPPEQPAELSEIISQYTIQDNALEKHAATDKPIQNIEQDKLGFGVYVTALHDFIVSQYTTTPLTISVDGPWGTGKSSLMYMLKNSLEPQNNIWQRFVVWLKTIVRWWRWFFWWFFALPVQTFGRVLLRIILKFDKNTQEFDFRVGKNNSGSRSLITDIAQGLSTNSEVLQQEENKESSRVIWWANVHAKCEPLEPVVHPTIWLNAWKFDNQEEVWASLALATLEQIKQKHNIFWLIWFRIRLTFKRMSFIVALGVVLLQFALPVILGIIAFYYSLIISSYDTPLEAFTVVTQGYGNYLLWAGGILSGILTVSSVLKDPFQIPVDKVFKGPNYKDKVGFLTRFEEDFARIINLVTNNGFGWKKSKLIIFVDDLDRCEPPKAADIVEAINLFLDADGCVFVIGMDSDSVAKSIEVKYKDLFDRIKAENAGVVSLGRAFLEKIVQIPFTVPRATPSQILNMVEDTLGGKISKGITIAQAKEKPVVVSAPESDQGLAEREDQPPAQSESASQPETITDENPAAKLDPASFARKEVRQAIHLGTELLSENPRQVKTFVNLFRLSIYVANAKGFFEEGRTGEKLRLIGLDRLAIWVTCSVRWQNLVRHLYAETQTNSLCVFLNDISKNITSEYKWTTGNKNIPTELKKRIDNLRKGEKSSEAHWCHLPWDWWLLEPDFLQVVKRMENLWASPLEGEANELKVLLNMSRPMSPTNSAEAK